MMNRLSVLYVDDDRSNLLAMQYALGDAIDLRTAESGAEALHLVETLPPEERVDVLVADQRMPGMSGVEVCRRFRELHPRAARILYTAYADAHAGVAAINEGGVSRVLVKPVINEDLLAAIFDSYERAQPGMDLETLVASSTDRARRSIELSIGRAMSTLMPHLYDDGVGEDLLPLVVSLQAGTAMRPLQLAELAQTGISVVGRACGVLDAESLLHAIALLQPESIELREEDGIACALLRSISVARDTRRVASAILERGGAHVVARDGELFLTTVRCELEPVTMGAPALRSPSLDALIVGALDELDGPFVEHTDREGALRRAHDARVIVVDEREHDASLCAELRRRGARTILLRVAQPDFVRHRSLAGVIDRLIHDGQPEATRRALLLECVEIERAADRVRQSQLEILRSDVERTLAHGTELWAHIESLATPLLTRPDLREAWRSCEGRAWPST